VSHEQAQRYFDTAIAYVTKSNQARIVYEAVNQLATEVKVYVWNCNGNDFYAHAYAGGGYIQWDPLNALQVTQDGWQSPAVALIHETYHAYQEHVLKDIYANMPTRLVSAGAGQPKQQVSKEELDCVVFESNVCKELHKSGHTNEAVRLTYLRSIGTQAVKSPTATGV
jgi:hypothetical protein